MNYSHLFGPVLSRRLGRSLGVDMVPFKTCNCNCVYCECGGDRAVSHERKEYIAAAEIINELKHYLSTNPALDYVTFAGSGEPTLNTALDATVTFVKEHYPQYKLALLTNGILFHHEDVRRTALQFDLVLPSLDAVTEQMFAKINRPHPGCSVENMVEGLVTFAKDFTGKLWVEVFIVPGYNDTTEEVTELKKVLLRMKPERVQLNSLDRPGACEWVTTAPAETLHTIARELVPLPVEIISRSALAHLQKIPPQENLSSTILHQLLRRPAPIEEIAMLCSVTINEIAPLLSQLIKEKRITASIVNGREFFKVPSANTDSE